MVGIPGKASVQMNMGVSSRVSLSSFSIDSCRSVYSDGKAVLTSSQLTPKGEERGLTDSKENLVNWVILEIRMTR
jgi:hypothetical protein